MPWHGDLRAETGYFLTREQEVLTGEQELIGKGGYHGSVGLMRSIPSSVGMHRKGEDVASSIIRISGSL